MHRLNIYENIYTIFLTPNEVSQLECIFGEKKQEVIKKGYIEKIYKIVMFV